ncbi:winged helix-turn-helix domain-containing protein [Nocardia sp. NPDC057668]|uniref:winged helix-turn-helix domain-containing protein n=1 Tax=Nocardia sp. NPDC057668 TaxID=3346202 RepID=UPI00366BB4A1
MELTPQTTLRNYLLVALLELEGTAHKQAVLTRMNERFGKRFTDVDWLPQDSNGEPKWQNQTAWERNTMVAEGLLERYVAGVTVRGVWTLTDAGRTAARHASRRT